MMNERELKLLLEAGAVKSILITAQGSMFHVEAKTAAGAKVLMTGRGDVRQWRSVDSCAKWLRKLGIGKADIDFQNWQANQKKLEI